MCYLPFTTAGITTVAGMSAADAVVRLSKTMLDGVLRGFSGDDENVKISITYEGVTYSRANTTLGNLLWEAGLRCLFRAMKLK